MLLQESQRGTLLSGFACLSPFALFVLFCELVFLCCLYTSCNDFTVEGSLLFVVQVRGCDYGETSSTTQSAKFASQPFEFCCFKLYENHFHIFMGCNGGLNRGLNL